MNIDLEEEENEIYADSEGVILSLKSYGDKNIYLELFVMDYGRIYASLSHYSPQKKNASRELQQFSWGKFVLVKNNKTHKYYIRGLNIISDSSIISMNENSLNTAVRLSKIISKFLLPQHTDNDLLMNFRGNMKLLEYPNIVPVQAAEFRFIWLWLQEWGLAPDLINFYISKGFNKPEIVLLTQLQALEVEDVIKLFSYKLNKNIRQNSLTIAVNLALNFFYQV